MWILILMNHLLVQPSVFIIHQGISDAYIFDFRLTILKDSSEVFYVHKKLSSEFNNKSALSYPKSTSILLYSVRCTAIELCDFCLNWKGGRNDSLSSSSDAYTLTYAKFPLFLPPSSRNTYDPSQDKTFLFRRQDNLSFTNNLRTFHSAYPFNTTCKYCWK